MGTTTALVTAGSSEEGTLMYLVSTTAPTTTEGFSETVPTVESITEAGNYNVYYYIKGDDTHSDSEIASVAATVLSDKYDLTFEAANDNTIEDGKASVTVAGTAATPTDGKVSAVKMGSEVKIKVKTGYKIKSVKAGKDESIDLSKLTDAYEAQDGDVLTGTLGANVKITIADGATVKLKGVTINGENNPNYNWAGLTCAGDATIILADGSVNTLKGFYDNYPGIFVPQNKTLTIKGSTGKLSASSTGYTNLSGSACGIGGVYKGSCGNIVIEGGDITATGGMYAAGIGSSMEGTCGNIVIQGGDIKATGDMFGAGIGAGQKGSCGAITISGGTVNATGGTFAAGIGSGNDASCGAIEISGGTVTAQGGRISAGIGKGYGDEASCTSVTITTGVTKVTSTKGESATNSIEATTVTIEDESKVTQN